MVRNQTRRVPWYIEKAGAFGPRYAKEHESNLTQERTFAEIDFLEKVLALRVGDKIFDCPCGHGRHSIELARRGYSVIGQDINALFLREARKAAKYAKVSVKWIRRDMREVAFEGRFDVALNLFSSFGYLESDEENQKSLIQMTKALKRGGKFVLDVINRDYVVNNYRKNDRQQFSDGSVVLVDRKFDYLTGRNIEKRVRVLENGDREEFSLSIRMYTLVELERMFDMAGLTIKAMYGNYNCDPLVPESMRYILIGEKN